MLLTVLLALTSPNLAGLSAFTSVPDLPYLRTGVQTHQFTSYDRAGDNYDADYFPIYKDPDGANVLFDVYGPGCLYRLHANLWNGDLKGVNIRFYFDDEVKPRIDMDVTKFFSEANPLGIFHEPYAHIGGGYRFVYHPFFFKKRLKISLNKEPLGKEPGWDKLPWLGKYDQHPYRRNHWYNFTYHTYTNAPEIQSWAKPADMSAVAAAWDPAKIGQAPTAEPQATTTKVDSVMEPGSWQRLLDSHIPGTITAIRMKFAPGDEAGLFDTSLQIRFDEGNVAQINVPLACFFGIYRTKPEKRIASRYVGTIGNEMYCYLPMPYWKGATAVLVNNGAHRISTLHTEIETVPMSVRNYPKDVCGTFHAVYNRQDPRIEGHDYKYADLKGQGQIVGHFTFRTDTSMEEDERTYFDGSGTPAIYGEGFEDDHNQGWGLRDAQQAIWGSTGSDGGSGAPWRFYTPDLYVFHSAVQFGHQVYGPHSPLGHEGMYQVGKEESVAFLYSKDSPGLVQTDGFDPGNAASEKSHAYRVMGKRQDVKGAWWYDGEKNNVLFKLPPTIDDGVGTDKGSEFRVRVDPHNNGVRLRRRSDKGNNKQLARVYVDGKLVTERPWFSVDFERTFRDIRWYDTDFEIPAKYTKGKSSIKVRVELVSSATSKWDEFRYWVYSYR